MSNLSLLLYLPVTALSLSISVSLKMGVGPQNFIGTVNKLTVEPSSEVSPYLQRVPKLYSSSKYCSSYSDGKQVGIPDKVVIEEKEPKEGVLIHRVEFHYFNADIPYRAGATTVKSRIFSDIKSTSCTFKCDLRSKLITTKSC